MSDSATSGPSAGQTTDEQESAAPLRLFLRTETGGAVVLLVAALASVIWINIGPGTYAEFWGTELSIDVGDAGLSLDLRGWVNSGLMTLFFFVVGLETRRELDMGELRERRRVVPLLAAGLAGTLVPVGIFLGLNAGDSSAHGWGVAMSTDTAFALGMLALFGARFPRSLRTFLLTATVVDDFVALAVIAVVYSEELSLPALLTGLGIFAAVLLVRAAGIRRGAVYAVLAAAAWVAFEKSGVDPIVVGLAMGLLTYAYPAARGDLERATALFRLFREQPTAEFERSVRSGIASALSPNVRLQRMFHPWSSYVVVPLFALANAGVELGGGTLAGAFSSPVTYGILLGYLVGKPLGVLGASWLTTRLSRGRLRPPVGWGSVLASGSMAGVGFTVSLLIATLALSGARLEQAKVGIIATVLGSAVTALAVTRGLGLLPRGLRMRALFGTAEGIVDLAEPVDPERDHVRGPADALVTLVEYGDFECPYCGQAEPVVRRLLGDVGDLRYVWRHLPLTDVHPHAQSAAEAAVAAARQGAFWEMHDLLFAHQGALRTADLLGYARRLGLDVERFRRDLEGRAGARRVAEDVESADLSGVSGTPTFFVNGRRHQGAYDIAGLSAAVRAARERALLTR
ncbi:Na+/H+ antiporter NhaA [Streptomyces hoynatensis]|uniref:Na+/H+ antiporter NhaA n=1 Tax=Streptomyces hoynatensis TaxID=1141874 RepID=UPI001F4DC329|nr:Na+/H+ antiporter NhaA [Streptomyces hoynatensis]